MCIGDLLLNPAWYWHCTLNYPATNRTEEDLVIGVPTRIVVDYSIPAWRTNPFLTAIALGTMMRFGGKQVFANNLKHFYNGNSSVKNQVKELYN